MNSYIGPDELIYNNDMNGNIHSGGFNIDSIMLKNGWSPITTLNMSNKDQIGGSDKVSDLFNNLVVPWPLSYNYKHFGGSDEKMHKNEDNNKEDEDDEDDEDVITEDLHEKLLNLVRASEEEMKKSSKEINKINKTSKNKTKKPYTSKKMVSNKKNTKKQK